MKNKWRYCAVTAFLAALLLGGCGDGSEGSAEEGSIDVLEPIPLASESEPVGGQEDEREETALDAAVGNESTGKECMERGDAERANTGEETMDRSNVEGEHFEKKNTEEEGAQENTWEKKGSIESGESEKVAVFSHQEVEELEELLQEMLV